MGNILFLHVGLHKTGTSAIQWFLGSNREILKRRGVFIPGEEVRENLHHDIALMASKAVGLETARKQFRETIEPIASNNKKVVISSEVFSDPNFIYIEVLNMLHRYFKKIRVIVYLRRCDSMIESAYNQVVKKNTVFEHLEERNFKDYYDLEYTRKLRPFVKMFGKNNIVVRPFEKRQFYGKTIFSDFMNCIETKFENKYIFPKCKINQRLTHDTLEYKRLLNTVCSPSEAMDISKYIIEYANKKRKSANNNYKQQSLLSPLQRLTLLKKSKLDYTIIAKEFLGRKNGTLFYDPLPDLKENWYPYNGITPDKVYEITKYIYQNCASQLKNIYEKLIDNKKEFDKYKVEAKEILLPSIKQFYL